MVSVCLSVKVNAEFSINHRRSALWHPWDASPPTLEIMVTKCIWSPLTFAHGCHFVAVHCGKLTVLPQTSQLNLKWEERRVGMGETWMER